ncbi:hypothetical protein [Woodsholea maritima]|uniref:hypothetical protein n=1 Tax=Woodsholea maritima TaxID=240237 RepID=UPI00039E2819|nr:hypothetical protein [Woodsholea maritima]
MKFMVTAALAAHLMVSGSVFAQTDDEGAIASVVDGLYASISGGIGEVRDWGTFFDSFTDNARMGHASPDGVTYTTPAGYVENNGSVLMQIGFEEIETEHAVNVYGEVAHVRSGYEAYRGDQEGIFFSGVNFMTLVKVEGEWKILTIVWRHETADLPVYELFIEE